MENSFRKFIEAAQKVFTGFKPGDIEWWAKYARSKVFNAPEEAKEWVFYMRERADKQPSPFAPDGTEFNRAFANAMPVYQSGKSFKIGKRIRNDNRFRLSHLKVIKPSLEEINQVAQANGYEYELHLDVKWIPVSHTISDNDYYQNSNNEMQWINELAYKIKTNGWIETVIYDYHSKHIIEGQHRARAMRVLGFNTVPGIGIEYLDD